MPTQHIPQDAPKPGPTKPATYRFTDWVSTRRQLGQT